MDPQINEAYVHEVASNILIQMLLHRDPNTKPQWSLGLHHQIIETGS